MRLGVFIGDASGLRTDVATLLANAREAEQLGFATGWLPHIPWSLDALTAVALAGQATSRIELGTAVVPTYPRHPVTMAQQALSAQAASNGRAVLGIGPSHPVVIEGMHGLAYDKPARHTAEYVDVLKLAFHCTGHVSHQGEFFNVQAMLEVPGASELPVLVSALAPLMLRVAGTKADGTITYWANERAIADHVVPTIAGAAATAGRPAPRVVAGIPVAVVSDVEAAKNRAATLFAGYNGIPAYQRIRGEGGGDELPDIAIIGDEKTVQARLRAYADAGATDLAAAVLGLDPDREASMQRTMNFLAELAPELAR
ncbi:MAG TPA: TIGR03564 family F420-dependent LLM class oxidoreductase [Frankiaceae bacterium]|jgi:F420-dependent oxidoreductase-like protein|nr:TIGR03564 family F420-dependent LLM class oxidoreductase [Frankiaceae bacterium]